MKRLRRTRWLSVLRLPPTGPLTRKVMALVQIHGVKSVNQFVLRQVRSNVAARLMHVLETMPPQRAGSTGKGVLSVLLTRP